MFFHIDESGNTGNELFDENQPQLSYGLLSSLTNVDAIGRTIHAKMLKELETDCLHANVLGVERLTRIAPLLFSLQKKMKFTFDYYYIHKPLYALTIFFNSLFDAGLNEAVKWDMYWTPMRFIIIGQLLHLFDEELLKKAWGLCIHKRINNQKNEIILLLEELKKRTINSSLDKRSKEVIIDAIRYGIANPLSVDFGVTDQKIVSPNAVCFQFIVSAMALRLKKKNKKDASSIIVDRQSQFNKAQAETHYNMKLIEEGLKKSKKSDQDIYLLQPLYRNFNRDFILRKNTPKKDISISRSEDSIGLQIVDIYLWITNRLLSGKELSKELTTLAYQFSKNGMSDGISIHGMEKRWLEFESQLPSLESLSDKERDYAQFLVERHREKVASLNI